MKKPKFKKGAVLKYMGGKISLQMKKILTTILIAIMLTSCAGRDVRDQIGFSMIQGADVATTYMGLKSGLAKEANPIYGESPSLFRLAGVMLAADLLINWTLVPQMDKTNQKMFYDVMIPARGGVVAWNFCLLTTSLFNVAGTVPCLIVGGATVGGLGYWRWKK